MKNIDEIYKDWCGEHHTTNSGYPVHDSAEAQDFAEYYHKEMLANEGQKPDSNCNIQHVSDSEAAVCVCNKPIPIQFDDGILRCDICWNPITKQTDC